MIKETNKRIQVKVALEINERIEDIAKLNETSKSRICSLLIEKALNENCGLSGPVNLQELTGKKRKE